jgi:hypothetical protein
MKDFPKLNNIIKRRLVGFVRDTLVYPCRFEVKIPMFGFNTSQSHTTNEELEKD